MDASSSRQPLSEALYNDYMEDQPRIPVLAKHKELHASNIKSLAYPDVNRVSLVSGGFGDFCFMPQELYRRRSNTSFIRAATDKIIPFFEFPEEIQLLIMEQWVQPLRVRYEDNSIVVTLRETLGRRCHPFRNGYQIEVPYSNGYSMDRVHHQNYVNSLNEDDYEAIRALSQTSHRMRKILQRVFWSDVFLNIGTQDRGYSLLDMLQDRPAVCGSIKKLRMAWSCGNLGEDIIPLCQYITSQLELDELSVDLSTRNLSQVKEMLANKDALWVQAFRKLKFKKLKIDLWIERLVDDEIDEESFTCGQDYDDMDTYEPSSEVLLFLENLNENDYEVMRLSENRRRMLSMVEDKKRNEERLAEWTEAIERHLQSTEMGRLERLRSIWLRDW